jgi:dipeptidyl-peptidase-4
MTDSIRFSKVLCRFMLIPAFFITFGLSLLAQEPPSPPDPGELTLDRIFDTKDFQIQGFGPAHWHPRLDGYTRLEKTREPGLDGMDIVLHKPGQKRGRILVSARQLQVDKTTSPLKVEEYTWSENGLWVMIFTESRPVWRQNTRGNYWVLNLQNGQLWQVGADAPPSSLMFAKFSPDTRRVAYVSGHDLYVQTLADRAEDRRITRLTQNGSPTLINGTFDWVYEEEFHLRDGFRWSPDSRHIAYWQLDSSRVGIFNLINNTDTLYPVLTPIPYPKAGTANSTCRIGIVSADGGETAWAEFPGDPGEHYIPRMEWAASSDEIVLQRMNRRQNENHLLLYHIDSRRAKTILIEKDSAWLDAVDDLRWFDQGKRFTWVSDRLGWQHIYVVPREGPADADPASSPGLCLTPGGYDVTGISHIDEKSGWIYFIASPENPGQRYLYRVHLSGRDKPVRLTPASMPGSHSYRISKDGRWAFHTVSTFTRPPTTTLVSLPDHRPLEVLAHNQALSRTLKDLSAPQVEFFDVDIGAGITLNAWCLKPADLDPEKRYPVLFFVYGEPWGQTVVDRYNRDYPWYTLLTRMGYVVMSVDNRGTPVPRGREWRKCVYGQIGILASADQAAAARAILAARPYLDPQRVGVWGWSGGGSMTLNLMFRHPELYKTGMSVAPVPDMRLYDTIYQERYMGLPGDNEKGYEEGSPITHAHKLAGNLLIVHGTGDDNVHYQGTERLINKLIEHDKPFTMMAYPNRSHGINEGTNTSRHLYKLLTRFLLDNLEPGGKGG